MQEAYSYMARRQARFGISKMIATVIIVILIAAAAIAIAEYGMHGRGLGPAYTTLTTLTNSSSVSSSISNVASSASSSFSSSASSASSSASSSTGTGLGSEKGVLSVLISDPPHLPDNVSGLYVTYSNMSVHMAGLPDEVGWVQVSSSGSIELLDAVNIGQTVASASIPAGDYNMICFDVSSVIVLYEHRNYTAATQGGKFAIHYFGSLMVNPSQLSALIVDMQPFVYNFGTQANPSFVLKLSAISFAAPTGSVTSQMQQIGNRFLFQAGNTWFWQYRNSYSSNVNISSLRLSSNSLAATIADSSNQPVTINAITVKALDQSASSGNGKGPGQGQGPGYGNGNGANASTPDGLFGSAVFLILPSGALSQLSKTQYNGTPLNLSSQIWGGQGYMLQNGASVSLSYSGSIQLALRIPSNVQPGEIVSGQQYLVSLVGDGVCANYVVTAS